MIKDVVNGWYEGNELRLLKDDGSIVLSELYAMEYPYFYSDVDLMGKDGVIKTTKMKVKLMESSSITEREMYKVEVYNPYVIRGLLRHCKITAESDVPYLERRLGADGIIEWVAQPTKYAYIDIEEKNGSINLIGLIDSIKKEYIPFYEVKDFFNYIYDNRITILLAWNGWGYDYGRIMDYLKGDEPQELWFRHVLQLDAMVMYSTYLQKQLIGLDKAAKEQGLAGKLELTKSFNEVGMDELVEYNKRDVEVLRDVVETTGILSLNCMAANTTGVKIDQVSAVRMFDNLLLKKYHNTDVVLASTNTGTKKAFRGGTVISEEYGIFSNSVFLDFSSLYPNIILNERYTGLKGGIIWDVMKEFVTYFLDERKKFRKLYDETKETKYDVFQKMFKIFANSLYGAVGNIYFRFYEWDIPNFITERARATLQRLRDVVIKYGYRAPYSDTDSVLIVDIPKDKVAFLENIVNKEIYPYTVKIEKPFKKILMMKNLKSDKGSKKRYAGFTEEGELVPVGLEMVRNDWTDLAKEVEEQVLLFLLRDDKDRNFVEDYLKKVRLTLPSLSAEKFLFSKVVDLQKTYKVKTASVKVLELAGYKPEEKEIMLQGAKKKVYVFSNYKEKLVGVRWLIGEKHNYIFVSEDDNPNLYKDKIDYDWYFKKQIEAPIGRILAVLGNYITVLEPLGENHYREIYGGLDKFVGSGGR